MSLSETITAHETAIRRPDMPSAEAVRSPVPTPGLCRGVPSAEYHRWDAASAHRLLALDRSPAHLKCVLDNPPEPTAAMAFGEMVHTAVLEPDRFASRYVEAPDVDRRTKVGKATWTDFLLNNEATPVRPDAWRDCIAMSASVANHPAARALLDRRIETELSAVWRCKWTNVLCKMRADAVTTDAHGSSVVVDLKTTEDASPAAFERTVANYSYHVQGGMYVAGLWHHGIEVESFVLIAVEKVPPYAVAVYRIDDEALAIGHDRAERLLRKLRTCQESGVWPAYSDEVRPIGLPRWAMRETEGNAHD